MTDTRDEGRTETPVVGLDQLHRYLADAFMRGADKEHTGEVPREYELRIAEAEAWAREYIDLRTERGLIRADPSGDVGEEDVEAVAKLVHRLECEMDSEPDEDPALYDEWWASTDCNRPLYRRFAKRLLARLRRTPETEATPEFLRRMAEWFDNPNESPSIVCPGFSGEATPGMMLRQIADEFALATQDPNA